jgi:hypothetical protein
MGLDEGVVEAVGVDPQPLIAMATAKLIAKVRPA